MSGPNQQNDFMSGLVRVTSAIFENIFAFLQRAIFRRETWTKAALMGWMMYSTLIVSIVYSPGWNVPTLLDHYSPRIANWVYHHIAQSWQVGILIGFSLVLWLYGIGILDWIARFKYQKAVDFLGLKTVLGQRPKVVRVVHFPDNRRKVQVTLTGLSIEAFQTRKGVLESSLNSIVQEIRVCPNNRSLAEILVTERELPTLVPFGSAFEAIKAPYSFPVGRSLDGIVVASLLDIHHMLIAGSTGGGKSFFFRQTLIGLLRSSKYLQLYIIDLKRGVEARPFSDLSNVSIAKDITSAIETLRVIHSEMERRFEYLEENKQSEIDPQRDKMDRIVLAIDEASELFTVTKGRDSRKLDAQDARELTDKLTKLGRAAGISVIVATQKVTKETIDTRVQTNMNARICFRVNTVPSSMTVLGNGLASELPEIPGRAVWSVGSKDTIVQVPLLKGNEMTEELELLASKFSPESNNLFQPMLGKKKSVAEKKTGFAATPDSFKQIDGAETT